MSAGLQQEEGQCPWRRLFTGLRGSRPVPEGAASATPQAQSRGCGSEAEAGSQSAQAAIQKTTDWGGGWGGRAETTDIYFLTALSLKSKIKVSAV